MSATTAVAVPATDATDSHRGWRRSAAIAAVAAPLAYALAVVAGVEHTDDHSRQLDIINSHTANFTAMVLLEYVCYILAAVTAVAVALRLASSRGGQIAAAGAVLTVIGSSAGLAGFGGAMPVLAKPAYRTAGLYFIDHVGPIYNVTLGLAILMHLGLLVMFFALWRSGRVAWPWLAVSALALVASALMGDGRVENTIAMLALAAGFVGIARFLAAD